MSMTCESDKTSISKKINLFQLNENIPYFMNNILMLVHVNFNTYIFKIKMRTVEFLLSNMTNKNKKMNYEQIEPY